MADASLQNVIDKISEAHGQNNTHFQEVKQGQDEQIDSLNKTVKVLQKIFTLQDQIRQEASEAAREAARISDGDDDGGDIPDGAKEEKRAGGFFSRMGKAIMNPVGAMGRGMKSMGKGIQGFLTGLANGLAAFANPMVLIGVTTLSISLPIFAAGLAAAFKVFDMIMGKGEAIKMVTAIIESFGRAIGSILKDILEGIGLMVQRMGPLITKFFDVITL